MRRRAPRPGGLGPHTHDMDDDVSGELAGAQALLNSVDQDLRQQIDHVRQTYVHHFPELSTLVTTPLLYVRAVLLIRSRQECPTAAARLSAFLPRDTTDRIIAAAHSSAGAQFTDEQLNEVTAFCELALRLDEERIELIKTIHRIENVASSSRFSRQARVYVSALLTCFICLGVLAGGYTLLTRWQTTVAKRYSSSSSSTDASRPMALQGGVAAAAVASAAPTESSVRLELETAVRELFALEPPYIVFNARVYTMSTREEQLPVDSFAVLTDGRFGTVGELQDVLAAHGDIVVRVDGQGLTVVPGLIDAHTHMVAQGRLLGMADLRGCDGVECVVERLLRSAASEEAEGGALWLEGFGWDQNEWSAFEHGEFPTREHLDAAFPTRPVWLTRVDAHAAWANTAALERVRSLALANSSVDPFAASLTLTGGSVVRNSKTGEPTGIFVDNAMELVSKHVPKATRTEKKNALLRAIHESRTRGLTGVHDAGVPDEDLELYRELADEGSLDVRVNAMIACPGGVTEIVSCVRGREPMDLYRNRLTVRSVKYMMDGALGSWGAAMLEPYSDRAASRGSLMVASETDVQVRDALSTVVSDWLAHGFQVAVHAIGDRANRVVLDAYEVALRQANETDPSRDHRLRIEHAQIVAPKDLPRFGQLGLLASMQPTHATADSAYATQRLGSERLTGAYAWRALWRTTRALPLGSDFPVSPVSPFLGLQAATTPALTHRLTLWQALRGFTADAAFASFHEHSLGHIGPSACADFLVLPSDPFALTAARLGSLRPLLSFLDGRPYTRTLPKHVTP